MSLQTFIRAADAVKFLTFQALIFELRLYIQLLSADLFADIRRAMAWIGAFTLFALVDFYDIMTFVPTVFDTIFAEELDLWQFSQVATSKAHIVFIVFLAAEKTLAEPNFSWFRHFLIRRNAFVPNVYFLAFYSISCCIAFRPGGFILFLDEGQKVFIIIANNINLEIFKRIHHTFNSFLKLSLSHCSVVSYF